MAEYISREAAIEALRKAHSPYPRRREISVRAIQEIPAADVRPVVLCQDCRYYPEGDGAPEDLKWPEVETLSFRDDYPCPCWDSDSFMSFKPEPDFYCAHGKRRERDNNGCCYECGADMRPEKEG